jgi:DnaJ like chaperone protein
MTGRLWGAVFGALIGLIFDQSAVFGTGGASGWSGGAGASGGSGAPGASGAFGPAAAPISEVFFRTTFELMGHVAKSDGRVSEAEIDAARQLMQELRLAPQEVNIAIASFRTGKAAAYDADLRVEQLREACGLRYDLLRAFMELQLRAALAGNGVSPPARSILTRVAARLGMSGLEFAHMESALRARQRSRGNGFAGRQTADRPLTECYAELEVNAGTSDQEVTKAYRRQMSRHHPDKLVANGLPESMAQVAKEKTQRIQEAYEAIRAARGMR